MASPLWPVPLGNAPAAMTFGGLNGNPEGMTVGDIRVDWCPLNHPQGALAFRVRMPGKTVVIATDHEYGRAGADRRLVDFCRDADVLVCDAQYLPEEMPQRVGWGHSTWEQAAWLARDAEVGSLVLTHHDPTRTDAEIDRISDDAKTVFPRVWAAAENSPLVTA
jgi:ribonuclease BN (tRNA processing enzyme)